MPMSILLTLGVLLAAPSQSDRLAAYIVKRSPKAKPTAKTTARAIVLEAKRHRLDVPLFAAIAYRESAFSPKTRSRRYEFGLWQLWPRSKALRGAWAALRAPGVVQGYPDSPWRKLSRAARRRAVRDIGISTYLAAWLLRWIIDRARCRRQGKPHEIYAHYHSGPRPRHKVWYARRLRLEARRIRRALNGP